MALNIRKNEDLTPYNTYGLSGRAAYLAVVSSRQELLAACRFAREGRIPWAVLGSGSNIVVDDQGYPGLLVINRIRGLERLPDARIRAGAGELLSDVVDFCRRTGLGGLERLSGIPGTLGGAVFGNAGAFGVQIGDLLEQVEYADEQCAYRTAAKTECRFSYRSSAFKTGAITGIIASAILQLAPSPPADIQARMDETLAARKGRHPAGSSCGSFFKNIEADRLNPEVRRRLADWVVFGRVPAGRLIQEAGLKGLRVGGAYVSEHHCNFLMNDGTATAADLKKLASLIKERVRAAFGVELEEEVRYL